MENTTNGTMRTKERSFSFLQTFGFQEERDYFLDNMTMLLSSGADALSAIHLIREELVNPKMRVLLEDMEEYISGGMGISDAFDATGLLSKREIALLRIGEESGKTVESLELLAKQEEMERLFTSKIRSASMYPVFVLGITVIVGIGISWFILPKLALVFDQLHIALPLSTRVLIAIGKFLQHYGSVAVPTFLTVLFAVGYFTFFFGKTKFIGQRILLRTPGIGRLLVEAEVARFGHLLGTLLNAGVPIVVAIESLGAASNLFVYRSFYKHLGEHVLDGRSLKEGFASYEGSKKLIPPAAQHMISAGSESGRLAKTLILIGERYSAKTESTMKDLSTLLEPALIILVWLGVITMAIAIITPIYSLIGGFKA